MSFLAGRVAGAEGAYFLQESKQAVARILQTQKKNNNTKLLNPIPEENNELLPSSSSSSAADVLPEVLRHSLPSKFFYSPLQNSSSSSFSDTSKWVLKPDPKVGVNSGVSPDALNPLRAYVSLPQVTFGPKRWQIPNSENSVVASTANDLRNDKYSTISSDKLKAAVAGLSQIGSAFAVATAIVFGGTALIFGLTASKLEMHNGDDIRNKGKDLVQPKLEIFKEQLTPLRTWAEDLSKKWHFEREESVKDNSLIKELSRRMGAKTST
ncbi:hypothetical protein ABFS82_08G116500 [Erythranthe guttata]|uniref:Uncharacterized protein n=1 Tax=Erythranthe guttata TaxID=4155 RepID=A0A022RVZ7_ERYGU|nr:PREDICTED: uncharacterized protein LOC105951252 [Erythranthe guttata]EYU43125.1 hypothetical protein MIMGU_mgv1a011928mg [Erythranthe guttata]|eukprot:XP_012830100.1 PREDICTED: uncharacterized protein LOC105951252 [Erythranthe guttata]